MRIFGKCYEKYVLLMFFLKECVFFELVNFIWVLNLNIFLDDNFNYRKYRFSWCFYGLLFRKNKIVLRLINFEVINIVNIFKYIL